MSLEAFKQKFRFKPELAWHIGQEREGALMQDGREVPATAQVLEHWQLYGVPHATPKRIPNEFGYELSACQLELRTHPRELSAFRQELELNDARARALVSHLGYDLSFAEIGQRDMPLDVYPNPRYQHLVENMPRERLRAACLVRGTHFHIGMEDHDTALRVYNHVAPHWEELCELGDESFGERLALYRQMAPNFEPRPYRSWNDFYLTACRQGFVEHPRSCWTMIRISIHGTIEFRMFGATHDLNKTEQRGRRCHELCMEALVLA